MEKNNNVLIGVLVVIVLGLSVFICYDKFLSKPDNDKGDNKVEEKTQNDTGKEEKLDINSDFVKELYNSVHVFSGSMEVHDYHFNNSSLITKLDAKDFNSEYKVYYGYRQIPIMYLETKKESCAQYNDIDFESNKCGYIQKMGFDSATTLVLDDSIIKTYVEKLFGEGSYQPVSKFSTMTGDKYYYSNSKLKYVFAEVEKGGSGPKPEYKMESASKLNDNVYIIEEGVYYTGDNFETKETAKFKLTFKKSASSYIFDSVEKIS